MERSQKRNSGFLVAFWCLAVAVVLTGHLDGVRGEDPPEVPESRSVHSLRRRAFLDQGRVLAPSDGALLHVTAHGRSGGREWKLETAAPFSKNEGIAIAASDDAVLVVKGRVVREGADIAVFVGNVVVQHAGGSDGGNNKLSLKNDVPVTMIDNEGVVTWPGIPKLADMQKVTIRAVWREEEEEESESMD